jgi:hypothetical protein
MANYKDVQDIKKMIEVGKCFDVALLDLCRRNSERVNQHFDPIIWEISQSLDYSTAAVILSLFAGKTVKFPSHTEIKSSIHRAAALADRDRGMTDSEIIAKYTDIVGSQIIKDIDKLEEMRKLADQWVILYKQLEHTYSGRDVE